VKWGNQFSFPGGLTMNVVGSVTAPGSYGSPEPRVEFGTLEPSTEAYAAATPVTTGSGCALFDGNTLDCTYEIPSDRQGYVMLKIFANHFEAVTLSLSFSVME
jgi:hypothetical protein